MPPSEATLTGMVFAHHAIVLGTRFGGQALAWIDKAALIAAVCRTSPNDLVVRSKSLILLNAN